MGLEGSLELGVRSAQHSVGQGESDGGVVELLDVLASAVLGVDFLNVNNLNGAVRGAVSAGHVVVQLGDGTGARDVAVLLVQVVLVGGAAVSQPNTVVLHVAGVALRDLRRDRSVRTYCRIRTKQRLNITIINLGQFELFAISKFCCILPCGQQ